MNDCQQIAWTDTLETSYLVTMDNGRKFRVGREGVLMVGTKPYLIPESSIKHCVVGGRMSVIFFHGSGFQEARTSSRIASISRVR